MGSYDAMKVSNLKQAMFRAFYGGVLYRTTRMQKTHRQVFPVTMASVDAVGIVFFGAYWSWFESAFEGYITAVSGSSWREVLASGLAMPVVHAEMEYRQPLRLSEDVTVEIRLTKLGSRSIHFHADFRNGSGELVAEAKTVNVVVGTDGMNEVDMPGWLVASAEGDRAQ
jgi:YbgC/YbaW family acyl-CoA thioester hydrolase